MRRHKCGVSSWSTLFAIHPAIWDTTLGSSLYLFKFKIKYGQELSCLNTKDKYGKVRETEIKWSITSKSVMIIILVEFINQLIDYLINCASFNGHLTSLPHCSKALTIWLPAEVFKNCLMRERQTVLSRHSSVASDLSIMLLRPICFNT